MLGTVPLYVSPAVAPAPPVPPPVALLGSFNTVIKGAVGSGRLTDVTLAQLATLPAGGSVAYVISVKDFWRWDPLSTLADNTATTLTVCNPIANAANPGRFIRELLPAPEWMLQTTWIVDGQNTSTTANDENDGLTAATALLTDLERERRMGPMPTWTALEYHIRYTSDTDYVLLSGYLQNSTVFLHGSMTDGQGQAILYNSTIDALVAQVPGTNTPYQITSNAIPVSWTASGFITATTSPNRRIRITSNTVGATTYACFDQGAKQARWFDAMAAVVFTAPFANNNTAAVLVNGSTFVIESLTQIKFFRVNLQARGASGAGSTGLLVCDSLLLGGKNGVFGACDFFCSLNAPVLTGCVLQVLSNGASENTATPTVRSCFLAGVTVGGGLNLGHWGTQPAMLFSGGGTDQLLGFTGGVGKALNTTHFRNNFFFQNGTLIVQGGSVGILGMAVFDPPAANQTGVQVNSNGQVNFQNNAVFWGGGTVRAPTTAWVLNNGNSCITFVNMANIALRGTTQDIQLGSLTTCPAFDQTTNTFTASRACSFANLVATVAAGGFGNQICDPRMGAYVGQA